MPSTPLDLQPTLRGELLELRPLRSWDFDALYAVARDPLIWEQHPNHDRWQEPVFREFFQGALDSGGAFLVVDRKTGEVAGSSRYHGYDAERSVVEIGWSFLARKYWGGVYNGEMKRLMLEHAFTSVQRVIFVIGRDNKRSRRAVEKIGGALITDGREERGPEKVVYTLTPEAFARATAPKPRPLPRAAIAGVVLLLLAAGWFFARRYTPAAAEECRALYQAARSAADSNRVDLTVTPAAARLSEPRSCGSFRMSARW